MFTDDFDLREWEFLPPLDDESLPDAPPAELVLIEWPTQDSAAVIFADSADSGMDHLDALHTGLAWRRPGLAEISRLASVNFQSLDAAGRIEVLADHQRQLAWWSARQAALLSLISKRDSSKKRWCVEEVGCALGLSGPAAQSQLKNAERLCHRLPGTATALAEGRIGSAQATVITEASYPLPDGVLPEYEAQVLQRASQQSIAQVRRLVKRAAIRLDPASAEQKHQRSLGDRQVRIAPADHSTAWFIALLPAAQAQLLYDRVDAVARLAPGEDPRTLDQLRADALVNAVLDGTDGTLPTQQGHQPAINVTVALRTLLGQDEEPGWLDGFGPITAGYARQLAHDPTGSWRRLVTDPVSGQLLDYGTTRYRPPRQLSDHVITRDGECTFPFCAQQGRRSDLDHIVAYPQGRTSADNLQPLHRRHHNAKTEASWRARRDPDTGETRWISPAGRHHHSRPPERWACTESAPTPVRPPPF